MPDDFNPGQEPAQDAGGAASDLSSSSAAAPLTVRQRRIKQLEHEIGELETALHTVLTTGKSYTLSNSHAVTRSDASSIREQLSALRTELAGLLRMGGTFTPLTLVPTKFPRGIQ